MREYSLEIEMAKDKEGHGSEAHREGHKPQVEHGKYGKGHQYHDLQGIGKGGPHGWGERGSKSSDADWKEFERQAFPKK